jgi:serine/threonine-protein kinase
MGERELTARSDVYALGCVLYEMLVGEPPFTGPTAQSIVAKVMTEEPRSVTGLRRTVPAHVDAALLTALEKLPADRFASAAAFAEALGQPSFTRSTTAVRHSAPPSAARWKRISIALGAAGVLLAAALVAATWQRAKPDGAPRPVLRFEVPIPDSLSVSGVVLSPDGARLLVLTESRPWIYSFADMRLVPLEIPGLRGYTTMVDFSPDGEWLAFIERRTLKLAPAGGGAVRTLIDSVATVRWGDDGFLYVNRPIRSRSRLGRVRAEGGAIEYLFEAEDSTADVNGFPLPGGRSMIIGTEQLAPRRVELSLLDIRTRRLRPLQNPVPDGFPIAYSPSGHLLLYGNDAVYAVPFDPRKLAFTGPPAPFLSSIPLSTSLGGGMFVHTMTPAEGPALLDRRGVRRELPGAITPNSWAFHISVSPDGKAFALFRYETPADRWDVYVYRLPAGPLTRLSPDSATINSGPKWSPDGSSIWFMTMNKDHGSVYRTAPDGSTPVEPLLARPGSIQALSPLPDGRRVVIEERGRGLELVSLDRPDSVVTLVEQKLQPRRPAVSRDGRWLAYSAMDLGRREVFVRAVDGGTARWKVSRNGGENPVWSWSGRELFFLTEDSLHAARLGAGPAFQVEDVRGLLRLSPSVGSGTRNGFDVLPGDSLFITIATARNEQSRIVVTANFYEQLRALTAPRQAGAR